MNLGREQRQTQGMAQTQMLSQQMQRSLKMLAMSLPELRAQLHEELRNNPCIEEIESTLEKETTTQKEREAEAQEYEGADPYDTDMDDHAEADYTADADALERRRKFFDSQTADETLETHLVNQLEMSDIAPEDIPLAQMLIGDLKDNGFFGGSIPDVMMVTGESEEKIRAVLRQIMELDPPGCGATTLEECFLAQLDKLDGSPYQQEVREILERHHLEDIAAGRIGVVEKDLGMSHERYADVLAALRTLEPRPARAYRRAGKPVTFVNPEVHAVRRDGRWVARVDDRSLPDIHVSKRYLRMLENPKTDKETRSYIREHIAKIAELEEAIEHRQETISNIAQAIFDAQPGFFDEGLKGLKPLTMQQIAEKVGVHHTTVSRTVNDKYVSTPKGTVELRRFFTQGFVSASGEQVARDAVADKIKALITGEDKANPLSDERIAQLLKAGGLDIARRTVAKYRLLLKIPGTAARRSTKSTNF
ncbi:MAG: RNA polymerase factor sigma-54 [Kiritimatiellia bacterium]